MIPPTVPVRQRHIGRFPFRLQSLRATAAAAVRHLLLVARHLGAHRTERPEPVAKRHLQLGLDAGLGVKVFRRILERTGVDVDL